MMTTQLVIRGWSGFLELTAGVAIGHLIWVAIKWVARRDDPKDKSRR